MSGDIIELGRHSPTPQSLATRLERYKDRIKHVSAIVTWDDGSVELYCDEKSVGVMCHELKVFDLELSDIMRGEK